MPGGEKRAKSADESGGGSKRRSAVAKRSGRRMSVAAWRRCATTFRGGRARTARGARSGGTGMMRGARSGGTGMMTGAPSGGTLPRMVVGREIRGVGRMMLGVFSSCGSFV